MKEYFDMDWWRNILNSIYGHSVFIVKIKFNLLKQQYNKLQSMQVIKLDSQYQKSKILDEQIIKQQLTQMIKKFHKSSSNSQYQQALPIIQNIVQIMKVNHFEPKVSQQYCTKLTQTLNAVAMIALQNNDTENCYKYLKRAEGMTVRNIKVQATTFNNLGCYYRKVKKLPTALFYLKKSLELQQKISNPINLPDTYINICAVLSSLGEHQQALTNVMMSIILLQHEILETIMNKFKTQIQNLNLVKSDKLSVLSLAHYNLGVQFQHLNKIQQATRFYDKAIFITQQYNPKNTRLLSNFERVKKKIQVQLKQKMILLDERKSREKSKLQNIKTQVQRDQFYKNLHDQLRKERTFYQGNNQQSRLKRHSSNSHNLQQLGSTRNSNYLKSHKKVYRISRQRYRNQDFF